MYWSQFIYVRSAQTDITVVSFNGTLRCYENVKAFLVVTFCKDMEWRTSSIPFNCRINRMLEKSCNEISVTAAHHDVDRGIYVLVEGCIVSLIFEKQMHCLNVAVLNSHMQGCVSIDVNQVQANPTFDEVLHYLHLVVCSSMVKETCSIFIGLLECETKSLNESF